MDRVKEYRARAAHCLSLARKSADDDEKVQLVSMAEVWEELAAYREQVTQRE
jgi:hypothetical protein